MIKEFVSRAMMVSMLEGDQLSKLHDIENKRMHTLANWNICEYFHLPKISDRYGIPDEPDNQSTHNHRIEQEILSKNLKSTEMFQEKIDWWHAYDLNIFHAKDNIVWDYSGSSKRGNIKDLLRGSAMVAMLIMASRIESCGVLSLL